MPCRAKAFLVRTARIGRNPLRIVTRNGRPIIASFILRAMPEPVTNPSKQLYIVVAPTEFVGSSLGCLILPSGTPYLGTYSLMFGPATREACVSFRNSNCVAGLDEIKVFGGEDFADKTLRDVKEIVDKCAREVAEKETVRERVERVGECLKEVLDRATEGLKEGMNK